MFGLFRRRQKSPAIRPMMLRDFTGQERTKLMLGIAINGAKQRGSGLEHTIIYGPPGLGKTTIANIVANEMKSTLHTSIGTSLQKTTDIIELFGNVYDGDIIFIDEIHRLPIKVEELLYTAMEDNYIDLGNNRIKLPKFTLIGATTRLGDLSEPLRDRFVIQLRLDYYTTEELMTIAKRTASVLGIQMDDKAAEMLASRSRGTPRVLNSFIRRARDIAHSAKRQIITETVALATFELLEIDSLGLDRMDRQILSTLVGNGNPMGLNTLAANVGENAKTIQEVYEPYLIFSDLVQPTSKGRVATQKAINHIRRM